MRLFCHHVWNVKWDNMFNSKIISTSPFLRWQLSRQHSAYCTAVTPPVSSIVVHTVAITVWLSGGPVCEGGLQPIGVPHERALCHNIWQANPSFHLFGFPPIPGELLDYCIIVLFAFSFNYFGPSVVTELPAPGCCVEEVAAFQAAVPCLSWVGSTNHSKRVGQGFPDG